MACFRMLAHIVMPINHLSMFSTDPTTEIFASTYVPHLRDATETPASQVGANTEHPHCSFNGSRIWRNGSSTREDDSSIEFACLHLVYLFVLGYNLHRKDDWQHVICQKLLGLGLGLAAGLVHVMFPFLACIFMQTNDIVMFCTAPKPATFAATFSPCLFV